MFCYTLLYVHSSVTIILMGKKELVALLYLSSWCLVIVEWLFLAVPRGCLQFVIVVFSDHTHLLFFIHKENVSLKINAIIHWFVFYFDYAYLIRLSDVTKPTTWQLPLQSICKYSNTNHFHIFQPI